MTTLGKPHFGEYSDPPGKDRDLHSIIYKHGGHIYESSGKGKNKKYHFALSKDTDVEAFHKSASEGGYEHGKHYSIKGITSQHTEVEDRSYTQHLKSGGIPFIPRNTV